MTMISDLRQTGFGAHSQNGLIANVLQRVTTWLEARRVYKSTYADLSHLSERSLEDVGITRGDIHTIAAQAAADVLNRG